MRTLTKTDFKVPLLLVLLSIVPTLGGIVRLLRASGVAKVTAEDARFVNSPVPVVIHVVCATIFCLLGAFQFSAGLRRRWMIWHRRAGKLLVACGLLTGITGMWMTAFYRIPPGLQGPILYVVRLSVGAAMIASLVVGVSNIWRRDVARHEAFMIRAYALGQGAGTQVLVVSPWMLITGETGGLMRDLLMTLAWAINIVVAEAIIRRRSPLVRVQSVGRARQS